MDTRTINYNENQLKRVGMGEAFTRELVDRMNHGEPTIEHPYKKEYGGDRIDIRLYFKKSPDSFHYFLNKYDASLQREGAENSIKQTFYVGNEPENKYTLKEAYNLLSKRPVFKNFVTKEGSEYQAWVKLNTSKVLDSGNYELKQYTKNYGFDLETTLNKYPVKELQNDQYKTSLIDSLHRGNLQKATFIAKEGKEEKLYISPAITRGALNIYDENKQFLPPDKLKEKGIELSQEAKKEQSLADQKKTPPGKELGVDKDERRSRADGLSR